MGGNCVLGDMLELGKHSKKLHAELAEPIKDAKIDKVLLAGRRCRRSPRRCR